MWDREGDEAHQVPPLLPGGEGEVRGGGGRGPSLLSLLWREGEMRSERVRETVELHSVRSIPTCQMSPVSAPLIGPGRARAGDLTNGRPGERRLAVAGPGEGDCEPLV